MLPVNNVTANQLRSLARAIKRLESWHRRQGGLSLDEPCLRSLELTPEGRILATISSGPDFFHLVLKEGEWTFLADALKL